MSSQIIASHRENAEIYNGDSKICKLKSNELLEKIRMPKGLLPLEELEEVGYNETTGFVWMRQKNSKEHKFKSLGKLAWYDKVITAFVEDQCLKKITGVKSKEMLIWISINEIKIDDLDQKKIAFSALTGLTRKFPVSAFEEEEE
ncbi:uncharacterized protein LOC124911768 [Impatiens glandulifera]|uniref:uncharacterized protein LOC124911768 n=1 Tax=Impatiens glandulifera TaxID=253017 RepID=UPI001FB0F5B0|nr:uncharacterized protein LOC124911768 [Impatiens glandulifera]